MSEGQAADKDAPVLSHEPTCAYYGLPFKKGSANKVCPCSGAVMASAEGN